LINFSLPQRRKVHELICADLSTDDLDSSMLSVYDCPSSSWTTRVPLTSSVRFCVISIQFALHYFFQSQATAHHLFAQLSRHLLPGGVIIITTIDCRVMRELLLEKRYGPITDEAKAEDESRSVEVCNSFQQRLLRISFDESSYHRIMQQDDEDAGFGLQYSFNLFDDDSSAAVAAPEWIVPCGRVLKDLLATHDLELNLHRNFHDFIDERLADPQSRQSFEQKHILNYRGGFSEAEWTIARLYCVMVLQKRGSSNGDTTAASCLAPRSPENPPHSAMMSHSFAPSSPDMPPPTTSNNYFAPSSPEAPPPAKIFAPSSPDMPPPAVSFYFAPSSPEAPPPTSTYFAPMSPEAPPPTTSSYFVPTSPDMPPPTSSSYFTPSSPDAPPPVAATYFAPTSPTNSPPRASSSFAPSSPQRSMTSSSSSLSPATFAIRQRSLAMELAGGRDAWDELSDDAMDAFLADAERHLGSSLIN
jgi:hypothetical protein